MCFLYLQHQNGFYIIFLLFFSHKNNLIQIKHEILDHSRPHFSTNHAFPINRDQGKA